ncbi:hypothetical protein EO244_07370 [Ancylomarina salipaludis]|uniref:Protein BatD n=1 Tax=Ancylomarina salipaludis TaxID=2501299 RepID=A0A4Q1JMP0_9BACT|nr:DUF4381 domain-containing protein [Ancylomarina salipaludis]RXQ95673.1 hypothetical protein EO244_07370 [Ancylomarina salipaludis]
MIGLQTIKKQFRKSLLLGVFALLIYPVMAQDHNDSFTYSVALDTNVIAIGDQIHLKLSVDQPKGIHIGFPVFTDSITKNIEIIRQWPLDTTKKKDGSLKISKKYLITSFDGGVHKIPPFEFKLNGENINNIIRTDTLQLGVRSFEIDTTKANFDIAMPIQTPVSFAEIAPWTGGGLLLIAILFAAYYFYRRYKRNQPLFKAEVPAEPAHVIALRKLEEIDNQKLWQKGHVKQYHSDLTDAVRTYLDERFNLATLESTTEETMEAVTEAIMPKDLIADLRVILERADLAKFAKFQPLPDENQLSLKYAYRIVEKTLIKETVKEETEKDKEAEPIELTKGEAIDKTT